jgi:hypothetical protein
MDIAAARDAVTSTFPRKYEPLLLTFYGTNVRLKDGLIAIGDDYGTTLYLNPSDRHIDSVDENGQLPTRFVNSSLEQLRRCLAEYENVFVLGEQKDSRTPSRCLRPGCRTSTALS